MKLLLDIGNSRIKWALADGRGLQPMQAAAYSREQFANWCNDHLAALPVPDAVRVANVAGDTIAGALDQWCHEHWRLIPAYAVTAREAGGVRNGYDNISEMGVDRWLAMVAARQLYTEPVCVISCGTAITVDAVDANGEHLGGLILPGPVLMQSLLNTATRGARTSHELVLELQLGRSTATGVAGGSAYAIAGMIERVLEQLSQIHGRSWRCLITGGGAADIMPLCRTPVEAVPDLVLRGLALSSGCI